MSQVICKPYKGGREGKPERQEVTFTNSVSKAVPKTEIKVRSPMPKLKSLFLGPDKNYDS